MNQSLVRFEKSKMSQRICKSLLRKNQFYARRQRDGLRKLEISERFEDASKNLSHDELHLYWDRCPKSRCPKSRCPKTNIDNTPLSFPSGGVGGGANCGQISMHHANLTISPVRGRGWWGKETSTATATTGLDERERESVTILLLHASTSNLIIHQTLPSIPTICDEKDRKSLSSKRGGERLRWEKRGREVVEEKRRKGE